MLLPEGVLVVNLHSGHRHFLTYLGRIQRSFGGAVLVVDDGELSNSVVFACKGTALERHHAGIVRRPKGLAAAGAQELLGALARVSRALQDRQLA